MPSLTTRSYRSLRAHISTKLFVPCPNPTLKEYFILWKIDHSTYTCYIGLPLCYTIQVRPWKSSFINSSFTCMILTSDLDSEKQLKIARVLFAHPKGEIYMPSKFWWFLEIYIFQVIIKGILVKSLKLGFKTQDFKHSWINKPTQTTLNFKITPSSFHTWLVYVHSTIRW